MPRRALDLKYIYLRQQLANLISIKTLRDLYIQVLWIQITEIQMTGNYMIENDWILHSYQSTLCLQINIRNKFHFF